MSANSKIFNLEARLKQSEPLLQYSKELQAQVSDSKKRNFNDYVNQIVINSNYGCDIFRWSH